MAQSIAMLFANKIKDRLSNFGSVYNETQSIRKKNIENNSQGKNQVIMVDQGKLNFIKRSNSITCYLKCLLALTDII